MNSLITHNLNLDYDILGKKFSYVICTNFLEFVEAKFNLNFAFVQLFIGSYRLKIIYIVDIMS